MFKQSRYILILINRL